MPVDQEVMPHELGARGDGRADDTLALQATFDADPASVRLPGGSVFRCTAGIELRHRDEV